MSYIRSGSNPEKLYVFDSGNVEFYPGADYPPFRHMPPEVFETLGCAYWKGLYDGDGFEFKGGWLKEVTVPSDNPTEVSEDFSDEFKEIARTDDKIQIGYKDEHQDWSLNLWQVTCSSMFDNFRDELRYRQPPLKRLQYMIRMLRHRLSS